MTDSIKATIEETDRRRAIQTAHNKEHGITPRSIVKAIHDLVLGKEAELPEEALEEMKERTAEIEARMKQAALDLDFETAAKLRDELLRFGVEFGSRHVPAKQHQAEEAVPD
jgi:excinuclease ABC subunit B